MWKGKVKSLKRFQSNKKYITQKTKYVKLTIVYWRGHHLFPSYFQQKSLTNFSFCGVNIDKDSSYFIEYPGGTETILINLKNLLFVFINRIRSLWTTSFFLTSSVLRSVRSYTYGSITPYRRKRDYWSRSRPMSLSPTQNSEKDPSPVTDSVSIVVLETIGVSRNLTSGSLVLGSFFFPRLLTLSLYRP